VVEYEADWHGNTPRSEGGYHLHIYGSDGKNPPASRMGNQSDRPGRYYLEDQAPSVRAITGGNYRDVIGDSPKVCARIADAGDVLVKDKQGGYETGNCVTIQDRR
jgi:molecular chaperone DnaK